MKLTLDRKGQGLTEYGIILLLILCVGLGIWFGWDIKSKVNNLYSAVSTDLESIIDDVADAYNDSVETYILKTDKFGHNIGSFTYHKTSVSAADLSYDGSKDSQNNGDANDHSVWWFINGSGYKEYKVGKANYYGVGMLQEVPMYVNEKKSNGDGYADMAAETYTYFKGSDGNTYQITYYTDNPTGTTLTKYTGDTSKITYVSNSYSGYPDGKQRH